MKETRHTQRTETRFEPGDGQLAECEARLIGAVCAALCEIQECASKNMADAQRQLEAGTYGFCLDCLTRIPAERLNAQSCAVRCAGCDHRRSPQISDETPDISRQDRSRVSANLR